MRQAFHPVVPLHLIQGIRLAHALMESRYTVCIPPADSFKFAPLRERFGADYREGIEGVAVVDAFRVDHLSPSTSLGGLRRPLIFPHALVHHCRSLWAGDRDISISFAGLLTPDRKKLVHQYGAANFPTTIGMGFEIQHFVNRAANKMRRWAGREPKSLSVRVGDLTVWSSLRGRTFPIKVWDQEYYDLLARSRFVLCPSGDGGCAWTYRFFESILCGAIPVVEQACPAYEGFVFHSAGDSFSDLRWSRDVAERNYELCADRITVPLAQMNDELGALLA